MIYEVHTGDAAHEAIRHAARYIAIDQQSPLDCARWLQRLWDKIDGLEEMPRRFAIDETQTRRASRPIHKMTFGDYLVFYTVDDTRRRVDVIAFRHGARDRR